MLFFKFSVQKEERRRSLSLFSSPLLPPLSSLLSSLSSLLSFPLSGYLAAAVAGVCVRQEHRGGQDAPEAGKGERVRRRARLRSGGRSDGRRRARCRGSDLDGGPRRRSPRASLPSSSGSEQRIGSDGGRCRRRRRQGPPPGRGEEPGEQLEQGEAAQSRRRGRHWLVFFFFFRFVGFGKRFRVPEPAQIRPFHANSPCCYGILMSSSKSWTRSRRASSWERRRRHAPRC